MISEVLPLKSMPAWEWAARRCCSGSHGRKVLGGSRRYVVVLRLRLAFTRRLFSQKVAEGGELFILLGDNPLGIVDASIEVFYESRLWHSS